MMKKLTPKKVIIWLLMHLSTKIGHETKKIRHKN